MSRPVTGKAIDTRLEELKAGDERYQALAGMDDLYAEQERLARGVLEEAQGRRAANLSLLSARRRELWAAARAEVQGKGE